MHARQLEVVRVLSWLYISARFTVAETLEMLLGDDETSPALSNIYDLYGCSGYLLDIISVHILNPSKLPGRSSWV